MKSFTETFIASTNLLDGIDKAALRRFDLKLKFGYLREDQKTKLFTNQVRNLGIKGRIDQATSAVALLRNCSPGDFANVVRKHRFRQFQDTRDFADALLEVKTRS